MSICIPPANRQQRNYGTLSFSMTTLSIIDAWDMQHNLSCSHKYFSAQRTHSQQSTFCSKNPYHQRHDLPCSHTSCMLEVRRTYAPARDIGQPFRTLPASSIAIAVAISFNILLLTASEESSSLCWLSWQVSIQHLRPWPSSLSSPSWPVPRSLYHSNPGRL